MTASRNPHASAQRPFPGLRPFAFEDHEYFFGREQQVAGLYSLFDFSRFIAVVGSSGSGKSSLVRAGLLPLLSESSGERRWRFAMMHPGDAPTAQLADALARLEPSADARDRIAERLESSSFGLAQVREELSAIGDDPILVVVDQFEELFRYAAFGARLRANRTAQALWRDKAAHFVQLLMEAARKRSANVYVLVTMRSDFIGDCAQFADLPEAVSATQFLVPGLTRDQREQIIRQPIEKAAKEIHGASIESALVERLLNDAGDEMDQLPVLQHALSRLWECAGSGHQLTLAHYREIGEMSGALSRHADEVMASLPGLDAVVEQVFCALSEVDKEGRATRRAIAFDQLVRESGMSDEDVRAVVDRFRDDDCSFVLPSAAAAPVLHGESRIDVVHEALLRRWDRISRAPADETLQAGETGWLWIEERDGRTYQALITLARGKKNATLPLDQVEERFAWWRSRPRTQAWANRYGEEDDLQRVEQLFADSAALLAKTQKDQQEQERQRVARRRQFIGLIAAFSIILAIGGMVAFSIAQRLNGEAKALRAHADDLQTNAQRLQTQASIGEREAAQLKRAAQHLAAAVQRDDVALKLSLSRQLSLNRNLKSEILKERLATAGEQAKAQEATRSRGAVFLESGTAALTRGDVVDAEAQLAAAYRDDPRNPAVRILLPQAREKVETLGGAVSLPPGHEITTLAYSPKPGADVFAAGDSEGVTTLWNARGTQRARFADHRDAVTAVAFDPGGTVLATAARDGTLHLHYLRTRRSLTLRGHAERIDSVAFSPDGSRLATSSMDGTVKLWSVKNGRLVHAFDLGNAGDAGDPQQFPAIGYDVQFTSDGSRLVACTDRRLRVWRLTNYASADVTSEVGGVTFGCRHLAISNDGREAVVDGTDFRGSVSYVDLGTLKADGVSGLQGGAITALSFDRSGREMLVAADDGTVSLFHAGSHLPWRVLHHQGSSVTTDWVTDAAFSNDGDEVVTAQADGTVTMYDLADGSQASIRAREAASRIAFAPSGDRFVTVANTNDGSGVLLWHLPRRDGAMLLQAHRQTVSAIAASSSTSSFATGSRDGTVVLWKYDGAVHRSAMLSLANDASWVSALHFNDAGTALTASGGPHIRTWDVRASPPRLIVNATTSNPALRFGDAWELPSGNIVFSQRHSAPNDEYAQYAQQGIGVIDPRRHHIQVNAPREWLAVATDVLPMDDGYDAVLVSRGTGDAQFLHLSSMKNYGAWTGISQAAYAPATGYVALGGNWGGVSLLNARTGKRLRYWRDHEPMLNSGGHARTSALAFSEDGHWLASAGADDGRVRIWDTRRLLGPRWVPQPQVILARAMPAEITFVQFSPRDPRLILTISSDGQTQLWSRDSGALLDTFALGGTKATAASFVAAGKAIAVGFDDGRVAVYPLPAFPELGGQR